MKTTIKISNGLDLMLSAWRVEGTDSYQKLNGGMRDFLRAVIDLQINFDEDDVRAIFEKCRGNRWFGVSNNGKNSGECFYSLACGVNKSFAVSFEKFTNRKPFILSNKRLHEGARLVLNNLYFHVTGFSSDNSRIYMAGYKDTRHEGKCTLLNFDNKEFLEVRKQIRFI